VRAGRDTRPHGDRTVCASVPGTWVHDGAPRLPHVHRDPADDPARQAAPDPRRVDEATGWFDRLYSAAGRGEAEVPWDTRSPHWMLTEWAEAGHVDGHGRRALVVGSGLGDDAEYVAGLGFETVGFDVSPSAVRAAHERFPGSTVQYVTANLLDPPEGWHRSFDLVVEILTVQSLPDDVRPAAIAEVARMVAPGGTLIVIATAHERRPRGWRGPPWPLTRAEVESFAAGDDDLELVRIEHVPDPVDGELGRWRAELRRGERR
jgi:SAM-dependent methyltransferase